MTATEIATEREPVLISTGRAVLCGILDVPPNATAVVILANGVGQTHNPVAAAFAARLHQAGLATLAADLLTPDERQFDSRTSHFSADVQFQSERILDVVDSIRENPLAHDLPIAGAAVGAAARGLLRAAGDHPGTFKALVIDGRARLEDLRGAVEAPTLLLVGDDPVEIRRAQNLMEAFAGPTQLRVLSSNDTDRAPAPFFSEAAAHFAADWLVDRLRPLPNV